MFPMSSDYLTRIKTFDEKNLPNLDEVVLAALEYLSSATIPKLNIHQFARPLVVGSVNALATGRILFSDVDAVFAEEGNYQEALLRVPSINAVYIFSASGGKHATHIAKALQSKEDVPVFLITSTVNSPAAAYVNPENIFVFPHIREPYTYNTSTYLGMLLGNSPESPRDILDFIETHVTPIIPDNLGTYESFILCITPEFGLLRSMFETKFDELFAPLRTGRSFTSEEIKHAKIVIQSETQCCINFGTPTTPYLPTKQQFTIPLPVGCGPVAMLAIGYYVIGHIQKQNEPYFKKDIQTYVNCASDVFGQDMGVIVE